MIESVRTASVRLAALWLAVLGRAVGGSSVRTFAVLSASDGFRERTIGFLFLWLGMAAVPAFTLAPLIGAIASGRFRWVMMLTATLAGLAGIAWCSYSEQEFGRTVWLGCTVLLAAESAFFYAGRFSLVPEAAAVARVSLPHTIGILLLADAAGAMGGLWVGLTMSGRGLPGLPAPLQVGHVGYGVGLLSLLAARFSVQQPQRFNAGLVGPFVRTAAGIFRQRDGRNSLLALWMMFAMAIAISQWLYPPQHLPALMLALVAGLLCGSLQHHPYRTLGVVPFAAVGLVFCALAAFIIDNWFEPAVLISFFLAAMTPPLVTTFTIYQPTGTRGHGAALLHAGFSIILGAFLIFLLGFVMQPTGARPILAAFVLGLAILFGVFVWLVFFRPAVELTVEVVLWPMYRVRGIGPGVRMLPLRGPLLVVGNHASWFDPFWLAKILPPPVVPMMTSKFYDLPVISWLMRRVAGAIRVPNAFFRKEAPELEQAIAALDRQQCVVIFPEGWLRRKEEQELRRFGRGVWQILKARPSTPVLPCWIDGGWGSMVSHRGGPPMKGKKLDLFRLIRVGVPEPRPLDPEMLADHITTRAHLMRLMLASRALLGMAPVDPVQLPMHEERLDLAEEESAEGQ